MKLDNTKRIIERADAIRGFRTASATVNSMLVNSINANSLIPNDIEALRKAATVFREKLNANGDRNYSVEHTMMLMLIQNIVSKCLANEPYEVFAFFMEMIAKESRIFTAQELNDNPYIKNIDFSDYESGDFELGYENYKPFELQVYDVPKQIEKIFVDIPRIGCFIEEFRYPSIYQKSIKRVWMSITPNEIFTMEDHIKRARGNVLTLGCGMGYFAYMVSLKNEVSSVTIIEREESVIELFESVILPQFEYKDKIKVIKADAIEYMKNLEDGVFDYCFADIWISVEDVEPYFAIKQIGKMFKKTEISYWIEESFALYLEAFVYMELEKGYMRAKRISIPEMPYAISPAEKRIQNYIERLFENEVISKPEHMDYYLNPNNLIDMINNTDLVY